MSTETHWEAVYAARQSEDLGWYEPQPSTLGLVIRFSQPTDSVIDVGGGDSRLVDELVQAGYTEIAVLDLSQTALDRVRSRLDDAGANVSFLRADVTRWAPPRRWDLWHDRAVFHFLVDPEDRRSYKDTVLQSLPDGGHLIIVAFAADGPEQCAGLPVERYDADALAAVFEPEFRVIEHHDLRAGPTAAGDKRPDNLTAFIMRCMKFGNGK